MQLTKNQQEKIESWIRKSKQGRNLNKLQHKNNNPRTRRNYQLTP